MSIIKIDDPKSAERVLDFAGSQFFAGERLQKFIQSNLSSISPVAQITLAHLATSGSKNVELWAIVGPDNLPLGGMTLNYYSWDRLSKQFYFLTRENPKAETEVSVEPFSQLTSRQVGQVETIQVAVELAYFAVAETTRGQGIGRQLFEHFISRVEKSPIAERLAFTIVMGKYSKTLLGDTLMKHMLRNGPESALQPVMLKAVLEELGHPEDIFAPDTGAVPTAKLAEQYGFSAVGYGRYLGEVWVKRM